MSVNKADKNLLISVGIIIVIFVGGYASLVAYSGFSSPFSIVMSQSMQHDPHQSEIGCIDTGDIVIVQDPSKAEIQSYIDGTKSGYQSFGDYGSVIIYNRGGNQNPVIHRAIIWLEYNPENDTWSAPSLLGYSGAWHYEYIDENGETVINNSDYNNIRGILYFDDITVSLKDVNISLDGLEKKSGFLTMGDNPETNTTFDQASSIIDHQVGSRVRDPVARHDQDPGQRRSEPGGCAQQPAVADNAVRHDLRIPDAYRRDLTVPEQDPAQR